MWGHSGKVTAPLWQDNVLTPALFNAQWAPPKRNAWMLALIERSVEEYEPSHPWVVCFNCGTVLPGPSGWRQHRDEWDARGVDCRSLPSGRCVID